jgi:hypothetical protein
MSVSSSIYRFKAKFHQSSYYIFHGFCAKQPVRVLVLGNDIPVRFYPRLLGNNSLPKKKTFRNFNMQKTISSAKADIVICHCPDFLLPRKSDFVSLPGFVNLELPITGTFDGYLAGLRHSARSDVRRAIKSRFSFGISTDPKGLEDFYLNLYVPSASSRFQEDAYIYPFPYLQEFLREGFLLTVSKDGSPPLAAYLVKKCGKTLWGKFFGLRGAADSIRRMHALPALTYELVRYAHGHKYEKINFGLSLPFRADPAFVFKEKWGNQICLPPHRVGAIHIAFKNEEIKKLFWEHAKPITFDEVNADMPASEARGK